jgi:hypothetical protein
MSAIDRERHTASEELVAYLDGELGADESRRIERLLADDPRVGAELRRLDQAWELLDCLPRAQLDAAFTRTTVEMIAVSVSDEAERRRSQRPSSRRRVCWLASGAVTLAALAGAWTGANFASSAPKRLLDDLAVLEHLEAYRQMPDLAFLRELAFDKSSAQEPPGETAAHVQPILSAGADNAARRKHVEAMDPAEKEQLVHKQKAFAELSPAERARLRHLDAELRQAPDAARLTEALERFQRWLNHLSAPERAHLQHAAGAVQRLARIKQLREIDAKRLGPADARAFADWWIEVCLNRMQDKGRQVFEKLPPDQQHEEMRLRLLDPNSAVRKAAQQRLPSADEFSQLRSKLSPDAQGRLDTTHGDAAKRALMRIWLSDAYHLRAASRASGAAAKDVSDERLRDFFEHLPDRQKNQLLGLPPEEMFRMLRARLARESGGGNP